MKLAQFALSVVIFASMASVVADAAPARRTAKVQAVPKSGPELYQYCRMLAFRRFGRNYGDGRLALYPNFVVEQQDHCVRNGGRL